MNIYNDLKRTLKIEFYLYFKRVIDSVRDESWGGRYESRMQKVVMNLVSNAIKYTSKGMVELCAINTGVGVEVSITDTGIGIQQERRQNASAHCRTST